MKKVKKLVGEKKIKNTFRVALKILKQENLNDVLCILNAV